MISKAPAGNLHNLLGQRWEGVMGGKYSAEWWEKVANINREASKQRDNRDRIDRLLQGIASDTAAAVKESEDFPPLVRRP